MPTFTFEVQGGTDTVVGATDVIRFAGGAFTTPITVGEYNDSTHVRNSGGTDISSANTPNNVKFISQSGGTGGDSQADWGDGTEDLDAITDPECTLLVNFSDPASVATSNAVFYAYDGTTPSAVPTGVTFHAAEQGDTNWTNAEGSAAALTLTDQSAAMSHDFFIATSASPESTGLKDDFSVRIELQYT